MSYGEPGVFYFEGADSSAKGRLFRYGSYPPDESVVLDAAEQTKLRELTLISLCETRSGVLYTEIASLLELPLLQVEPFVLQAILSGAIDGQLDASHGLVRIRNTAVRNASPDDIAAALTN